MPTEPITVAGGCDPLKGCGPSTHNLHCAYPECAKGRRRTTAMPTDPITVEVVCPSHYALHPLDTYCGCCGGHIKWEPVAVEATLSPDSLAAAKIALADAVDRWECASRKQVRNGQPDERVATAYVDYLAALAALRAHPDYKAVP